MSMADFVPSIFRFYVILSSPMPVDWFCAIYFGWVNIWWEKLYIIIFYIFFRYFFILATDWFCAIYFRWVNIWLGKLYIFVFHIFLVIFSSWQLIDFAPYISWWVNIWWEKLAPIGRTDTSKPCCTFNDRPGLWNNKDANKVVVVEMGLFLFCTYMVLWVHEICPKVLSTV